MLWPPVTGTLQVDWQRKGSGAATGHPYIHTSVQATAKQMRDAQRSEQTRIPKMVPGGLATPDIHKCQTMKGSLTCAQTGSTPSCVVSWSIRKALLPATTSCHQPLPWEKGKPSGKRQHESPETAGPEGRERKCGRPSAHARLKLQQKRKPWVAVGW